MKLETEEYVFEAGKSWDYDNAGDFMMHGMMVLMNEKIMNLYREEQDVGAGALVDTKMQAEGLQCILQADAGSTVSGMDV